MPACLPASRLYRKACLEKLLGQTQSKGYAFQMEVGCAGGGGGLARSKGYAFLMEVGRAWGGGGYWASQVFFFRN